MKKIKKFLLELLYGSIRKKAIIKDEFLFSRASRICLLDGAMNKNIFIDSNVMFFGSIYCSGAGKIFIGQFCKS